MLAMEPQEMIEEKLTIGECMYCEHKIGWGKDMIGSPVCCDCSVDEVQRLRGICRDLTKKLEVQLCRNAK